MKAQSCIYAPLNHLSNTQLWLEEKLYEIWVDKLPPGAHRTNVTFEVAENVPLADIRSLGEYGPSLDKEGFQVFDHPLPKECPLKNVDDIDSPEKCEAVKEYLKI
jgi:hypothetical protein